MINNIISGIIASIIVSYIVLHVQLILEIQKSKTQIMRKMYYYCLNYTKLINPKEQHKRVDLSELKDLIENIFIFNNKFLLTRQHVNNVVDELMTYLNKYFIQIMNEHNDENIKNMAQELIDILKNELKIQTQND